MSFVLQVDIRIKPEHVAELSGHCDDLLSEKFDVSELVHAGSRPTSTVPFESRATEVSRNSPPTAATPFTGLTSSLAAGTSAPIATESESPVASRTTTHADPFATGAIARSVPS